MNRMTPSCLLENLKNKKKIVFCASHFSVLQAEIVKRLNAICAQVIPFLSQEVRLQNACHCELRRRWVRESQRAGGRETGKGRSVWWILKQEKEKYRETHTHADTHTRTDYPGLIPPAQDRQICSELIKCLPLTYAGASG